MTARLFVPDGPAVTPAERRQRLAEHRAAQQTLSLGFEADAIEDGAAWVQATAPFGVWFDDTECSTPTLAEYTTERNAR